jgi:hypothetical protein
VKRKKQAVNPATMGLMIRLDTATYRLLDRASALERRSMGMQAGLLIAKGLRRFQSKQSSN